MGSSGQGRAPEEIERLHKALEAETERAVELQRRLDRAGAEFEEFVSIAAHNLRESLREVAAFSQLMAETYTGRLDSDAGVFLARIREGAARMQALLSGVVDYWATGSGAPQFSAADMEVALNQALLLADKQISESGAVVTHDPLPAVTGDFGILIKVLHHLIGNAIEYRGAAPPRIHISSRREDSEWVFSVRDNGPGIDPAFHDRVFGAFQRLHGKEYPGNGLGLAFCRKAIERQGGRMWLESAPGAGSTFHFAVPAGD